MRASAITVGAGVCAAGFLAIASPATAQDAAAAPAADSTAPAQAPDPAPAPATDAQPAPAPAPAPDTLREPLKPKSDDPGFTLDNLTTYGTLGLSGGSGDAHNASGQTGIFTGEAGVRFGPYLGVEAEGATTVPGASPSGKKLSLVDRYAGYIVGYLPLSKHFDLFAKFGLGHSRYKYEDNGSSLSSSYDSVNWGLGAQYFFSDRDGVRTEVLKETYRDNRGERNSVNISWVHKFY